jgi:hypothetical protein
VRFTLHRSAATPSGPAAGAHALDDALWPAQARQRRIALSPVATLLTVCLVALLGLWGGAELQKRQSGATSAAAPGPAGGFAGRFGGGTRAGTVTVISGKTLYLTSPSGTIVKATLTGSTTYSRDSKATKSSLKPGDTAIVQGAKNSAGVVVATSVAATAKGVTSTAGAIPGGPGGGATPNGTTPGG